MSQATSIKALDNAKRLVLKVGSALLVGEDGLIRQDWLNALADDVAWLMSQGREVILVSSGAIAVGRIHLGLPPAGALRLGDKQAAAATGQIKLAHAYQEAMARHDKTIAQILITSEDTEERERHLNARATLKSLLGFGAVPVINENDTVATAEIRYGDNDRLAARVASMAGADLLILFSDIDGLYTDNPKTNPDAKHLPLIEAITPDIEAMAGEPLPGYSSGGMVTKITAAKLAVQSGTDMIIAKGEAMNPVRAIADGARTTLFQAPESPLSARKSWIAGSLNAKGSLVIDRGAVKALNSGKSLLPAGVRTVIGDFQEGEAVSILDLDGTEIARGLSSYSAAEAKLIAGHQSQDIERLLGHQGRQAVIHRDDLAVLG